MSTVIANIIAGIGVAFFFAFSASRNKKLAIVFQTCAMVLIAIGNVMLGGFGGAVLNLVAIARNAFMMYGKTSKTMRYSFTAAICAVSFGCFWATGFADKLFLLPLFSNVIYTMLCHYEGKKFKKMSAASFVPWVPYDIAIGNYVCAISDAVNIFLNLYAARKTEDSAAISDNVYDEDWIAADSEMIAETSDDV